MKKHNAGNQTEKQQRRKAHAKARRERRKTDFDKRVATRTGQLVAEVLLQRAMIDGLVKQNEQLKKTEENVVSVP